MDKRNNFLTRNKRNREEDDDKDNKNNNFNNHNRNNQNRNNHHIHIQPQISKTLPISNYKEQIIEGIKTSQVMVIAGETGCGKTTQVPQYIYNSFKENNKHVNILITQPRRIAAFSIANRLCYEMNVKIGEEVGYHVGMSPIFRPETTRILIMTTGIFLQRLIHEKNLDEYTHVILDEVHERDIDIDFVLVLMKHILAKNKNIKLILMSATISTHLFANYFANSSILSLEEKDHYEAVKKEAKEESEKLKNEIIIKSDVIENTWNWDSPDEIKKNNSNKNINELFTVSEVVVKKTHKVIELANDAAPIVKINEKIYPVQIFYLNKFIEFLQRDLKMSFSSYHTNFDKKFPKIDTQMYEICYYLIKAIHLNYVNKERDKKYHILIFLPGFGEIENMSQILNSKLSNEERNEMEILKLHSNLQDEDQQKVFIETHKRKVILSTNIAESSITINGIYYVIDFCLVKELKFNIRNNAESLELNWASKASLGQRAGRAGRVGEGFVFRLVPQDFFHNCLEDFSNPEILRVPLEKLILRVKVLNFGEPEIILGRALEPPNLKQIESAINNLQNYGALTLKTENSPTGELTELGKVFSEMPTDLKYSRLIMLAYAFDLLEPAIVLSSVFSQEKNIFKKTHHDKNFLTYNQRAYYANDTHSDMIAYYNAFKSWEANYGEKIHKNVYSRRISYRIDEEEKIWTNQYKLDPKILRDVLMMCADIKMRLRKLNLLNEQMSQHVNFDDQNNIILFKIILAGAFYGQITKCQYADIEKLNKLKNTKNLNYKINQAITLKCIPDEISEKDLKVFINEFGQLKELRRYGEDVLIVFQDNEYQTAIKKILTVGSNFRPRGEKEFVISYVERNGLNNTIKLKRPEYHFEIKNFDVFKSCQVDFDYYSINHVVIEENEKINSNLFFVYEDFHNKHGKIVAKHSTLMPKIPMLDIIIMLVFTPRAEFFPNEEGNQYSSFRVVGSEMEFKFSHLFAGSDVNEINSIRILINEIIANKNLEFSTLQDKRNLLKENFLNLLNKSRIKFINNEEWWRLFYNLYPQSKKDKERNLRLTEDLMKNIGDDDIQLFTPIVKNNIHMIPQEDKNINKKSNDFLPPLNLLGIKEDYRLWHDQGINELQEEKIKFNSMRDYINRKINENKKMIILDKSEIACGECCSYICSAKNMTKFYPNKNYEGGEDFKLFNLSGYISGFVNLLKLDDPIAKDSKFVYDFYNNLNEKVDFWMACKSNHILGFKTDDNFYLTKFSKLNVIFPTNISEKFNESYWINNFWKLYDEEKKYLANRNGYIKNGLKCDLCDRKVDKEDYLNHLTKDMEHKRRKNTLDEEVFE